MPRLHLIEIEDQPWCPTPVRDGATDYLQFVLDKLRPYRPVAGRLAAAIRRTGSRRVIDLCSGAGGPWPGLLPEVRSALGDQPLEVLLTDLYPNQAAWEKLQVDSKDSLQGYDRPVDATRVPAELEGFRTLFSGFHHFRPEQARAILQDAVANRQGIGIFETTERKPEQVVGMLFVPLIILLVTPAIRPVRLSRLLLTYLLPAIPFIGIFDGVVSCLRTYTPAELEEMTALLQTYTWEVGQDRNGMAPPVTYVLGYPSRAGDR